MEPSPQPPPVADTVVRAALAAIPYAGGVLAVIYEDVRARHVARTAATIDVIAQLAGSERLAQRLGEAPEVEALFLDGVEAASRTGLEAKRRLLARVIAQAVLDDARLDEAQLLVQALRDLDAPHIRALERIRRAEDEAASHKTEDSEKPNTAALEAGRREPLPVLAVLVRTGVALQATLVGGGLAVWGISPFGRTLLEDLRRADDASAALRSPVLHLHRLLVEQLSDQR